MNKQEIIWLASYPKSGNTWLRFFLYSYYFGIPLKSEEINRRIPDIHETSDLRKTSGGSIFCKTHFLASNAHPHFQNTAGIIYILRHPRDVLLSNLNYFYLTGHAGMDAVEFAKAFIRHKGVPYWKSIGMGSWRENVHSWLESGSPKHVIRYEELRSNPHEQFASLLGFLGEEVDDRKLEQAINRSSFDNMRRLENKEKKQDIYSPVFWGNASSTRNGLRFINKGGVNQKLTQIDPELDSLFDKVFEEDLRNLGYKI